MKLRFFGYEISVSREEADELEVAKAVLEKHGFRAVRKTEDKSNKVRAAAEAAALRAEISREKVERAIKEIEDAGEKVTIAKVAKIADVSRITAKKYISA
ncbi:MAG: hypothetical protein GXO31_03695 [Epsilonproteobacteria bacterium]|nr:hypothetical protein [Campylobacterota bacterium]